MAVREKECEALRTCWHIDQNREQSGARQTICSLRPHLHDVKLQEACQSFRQKDKLLGKQKMIRLNNGHKQ